ncbi:hypothetical protein EV126DRAFT_116474 [Verticillium dahliae]|nr:hypothetical protein EV126DRAFT_116474 [Verticillium dahliae]
MRNQNSSLFISFPSFHPPPSSLGPGSLSLEQTEHDATHPFALHGSELYHLSFQSPRTSALLARRGCIRFGCRTLGALVCRGGLGFPVGLAFCLSLTTNLSDNPFGYPSSPRTPASSDVSHFSHASHLGLACENRTSIHPPHPGQLTQFRHCRPFSGVMSPYPFESSNSNRVMGHAEFCVGQHVC